MNRLFIVLIWLCILLGVLSCMKVLWMIMLIMFVVLSIISMLRDSQNDFDRLKVMVVRLKMFMERNMICLMLCLMLKCVSQNDIVRVFIVGVECSRLRFQGLVSRMFLVNIGSRVVVLLRSMVNRLREIVLKMFGWLWMKWMLVSSELRVVLFWVSGWLCIGRLSVRMQVRMQRVVVGMQIQEVLNVQSRLLRVGVVMVVVCIVEVEVVIVCGNSLVGIRFGSSVWVVGILKVWVVLRVKVRMKIMLWVIFFEVVLSISVIVIRVWLVWQRVVILCWLQWLVMCLVWSMNSICGRNLIRFIRFRLRILLVSLQMCQLMVMVSIWKLLVVQMWVSQKVRKG